MHFLCAPTLRRCGVPVAVLQIDHAATATFETSFRNALVCVACPWRSRRHRAASRDRGGQRACAGWGPPARSTPWRPRGAPRHGRPGGAGPAVSAVGGARSLGREAAGCNTPTAATVAQLPEPSTRGCGTRRTPTSPTRNSFRDTSRRRPLPRALRRSGSGSAARQSEARGRGHTSAHQYAPRLSRTAGTVCRSSLMSQLRLQLVTYM